MELFDHPIKQQPNALCRQLFTNAIANCSKSLALDYDQVSWSNKFTSILPAFLRKNIDATGRNDSAQDPILMSQSQCADLMYRVSNDYVKILEYHRLVTKQYEIIIIALVALLLSSFLYFITAKLCFSKPNIKVHKNYKLINSNIEKDKQIEELQKFIEQRTVFLDLKHYQVTPHSARSDHSDSHSNSTYRVLPSRIPIAQSSQIRPASSVNNISDNSLRFSAAGDLDRSMNELIAEESVI